MVRSAENFGNLSLSLVSSGGRFHSTVVVTELSGRARDVAEGDNASPLLAATYQGTVLATAAMGLRNGVILMLLSPAALLIGAGVPLLLMLVTGAVLGVLLQTLIGVMLPKHQARPLAPTAGVFVKASGIPTVTIG